MQEIKVSVVSQMVGETDLILALLAIPLQMQRRYLQQSARWHAGQLVIVRCFKYHGTRGPRQLRGLDGVSCTFMIIMLPVERIQQSASFQNKNLQIKKDVLIAHSVDSQPQSKKDQKRNRENLLVLLLRWYNLPFP